jgi:large subunit ribosomal protein L25
MILEAKKREGGNLEHLRKGGDMPAVFYGPKEEATPIAIRLAEFKKVWKATGESSILTLKYDGKELESLIHEVSTHAVSGEPLHADFYIIEKGKKVSVMVPLEFIGVSEAVKGLGGTLVKVAHEIEIEALPKDLPHGIDVDISVLTDFEKQITVKDLKLPPGVEVVGNPEDVIAMVQETKEEVFEEVVAPDLSTIEVEKKGKEETEGEEGASEEGGAKE